MCRRGGGTVPALALSIERVLLRWTFHLRNGRVRGRGRQDDLGPNGRHGRDSPRTQPTDGAHGIAATARCRTRNRPGGNSDCSIREHSWCPDEQDCRGTSRRSRPSPTDIGSATGCRSRSALRGMRWYTESPLRHGRSRSPRNGARGRCRHRRRGCSETPSQSLVATETARPPRRRCCWRTRGG
jgi:hypothetical protein